MGAFRNAGQGCISLERAYVAAVYDEFLDRVLARARTLRAKNHCRGVAGELDVADVQLHLAA